MRFCRRNWNLSKKRNLDAKAPTNNSVLPGTIHEVPRLKWASLNFPRSLCLKGAIDNLAGYLLLHRTRGRLSNLALTAYLRGWTSISFKVNLNSCTSRLNFVILTHMKFDATFAGFSSPFFPAIFSRLQTQVQTRKMRFQCDVAVRGFLFGSLLICNYVVLFQRNRRKFASSFKHVPGLEP